MKASITMEVSHETMAFIHESIDKAVRDELPITVSIKGYREHPSVTAERRSRRGV